MNSPEPNNNKVDSLLLEQVYFNLEYAKILALRCNNTSKRNVLLKLLDLCRTRVDKQIYPIEHCWEASFNCVKILQEQQNQPDFQFDFEQ